MPVAGLIVVLENAPFTGQRVLIFHGLTFSFHLKTCTLNRLCVQGCLPMSSVRRAGVSVLCTRRITRSFPTFFFHFQ